LKLQASVMKEIARSGGRAGGARDELDGDGDATAAPKLVDRAAARLQQLEKAPQRGSSAGGDATTLSTKEYADHVDRLQAQLAQAWASDERVHALKLAIQSAKLLAEASAPHFYPAMFVLTTQVLDAFARLVYDRIKERADDGARKAGLRRGLGDDWKSADVCADAKETCRNWFYKTACIRELLPRFYVEVALLGCYRFLSDGEVPRVLSRLASITRGIGDPLIAAYARCYLSRAGSDLMPGPQPFAVSMFQDHLFCFNEVKQPRWRNRLRNIDGADYARLAEPAVEWLLKCVGSNATAADFEGILSSYRDYCNDATVLRLILYAFPAAATAAHPLALVQLAKAAVPSRVSTVELLGALGARFAKRPPPREQRLAVLNDVWKVAAKCVDFGDYILCATAWLDVLLKHYSQREVRILLGDVIRHVDAAVLSGALQQAGEVGLDGRGMRRLEDLVEVLVAACADAGLSSVVLASDHLLKLMDLFRLQRKVEIAKELLASRGRRSKTGRGARVVVRHSDPVLVHTVLEVARVAHDSVDSLSPDGERNHVAGLICGFVETIDFGRDVEQQLNVYVECRAAFANLDAVLDRLVLLTARLAVHGRRLAEKSSRAGAADRATAFAKACLAYCHVTIPSIDRICRRLRLLALCGHVALLNNCLPHADTFFKAAVALIPDAPAFEAREDGSGQHTEQRIVAFVQQLASSLVVVPGHPTHGPFYLVQGLLNALPRYQHWQPQTGCKSAAFTALLPLLAAQAQRRLPLRVAGVEGNDVLYGGAPDFLAELQQHLETVVAAVVTALTALGTADAAGLPPSAAQLQRRAELVLDFVNALIAAIDVGESATSDARPFAKKLLGLAAKHKDAPALRAYFQNSFAALQNASATTRE